MIFGFFVVVYYIVCSDFTVSILLSMLTGLLAAPSNLKAVSITTTAIHLTWDHPYTLDITGIDPDISGYVIYIRNANTGNTTTAFVTETEYTFVRQDFRHCDMFEFRVQTLNVVGEGNVSDPVAAAYLGRKHPTTTCLHKLKENKPRQFVTKSLVV